jgi:pyridoxal phosphate enzyme (YggS family)
MNTISKNITSVLDSIPDSVTLVAVSKTKPNEDIMKAYNTGHRVFGENKVQELTRKSEELPRDIEWHFIGHLQSNKVKYLAPFVSLIHGVDSFKLLKTVNKEAKKNNRVINCLLQCKIAEEETKFGMTEEEVMALLDSDEFKALENISIRGIMGMATNTRDEEQVNAEFQSLKSIFTNVKSKYFAENSRFSEISMGMSHDYKLAINAGATMIRLGSIIFGERNYSKTQ